MSGVLRVVPDALRAASAGWEAQLGELHATPPALEPPVFSWPSMLAAGAVSGTAAAVTAELHTRITATSVATRGAASGYEAGDAEAADAVRNVITTLSDADRQAM